MSYTKTIVCLANSRKPPSGRCIAGLEANSTGFGAWVRPVSNRETQEISEEERRYKDGTDPKLLDVIKIKMIRPVPHLHQQENHLIDDGYYWMKKGIISWDGLLNAVEDPAGPLWINGYSSMYGQNDRIPDDLLNRLNRSLYLVRPDKLKLIIASEGGDFGPLDVECALISTCSTILTVLSSLILGWSSGISRNLMVRSIWRARYSA
ncbi:MAG: hypothetical protein PHS96_09390 [Anaerolineales bacterium]|nr:hypothetical protein [Anaerolineales bacterium]